MNPFGDPKKMKKLEKLINKYGNKSIPLSDAENKEAQKHAWGD